MQAGEVACLALHTPTTGPWHSCSSVTMLFPNNPCAYTPCHRPSGSTFWQMV